MGNRMVGRGTNRLTDRTIRGFVSRTLAGTAAHKKLFDGGGMFLTVTKGGTAVWRLKYRIGGVEKLCSLGTFPSVSLSEAREQREALTTVRRDGGDPVTQRRVQRASRVAAVGNTLEAVVELWLAKESPSWSTDHEKRSRRALERDILVTLGKVPVDQITPAMLARAVEAIAVRGARETAVKVLQHCAAIFRLAQARGLCAHNPAIPVREVLAKKRSQGRRAALLEWHELGDLLRRAEAARLSESVRMAHRLCAFTAMRIGNVVEAEWQEFDLDADVPVWVIPRSKMKEKERPHDHTVVLAPSFVKELRQWRGLQRSDDLVCPSPTGKGIVTREALEKAYRVTLGLRGRHSPHGWRSAFSTLARDHGFERDVVELALDHVHDTAVVRAYNRGDRMKDRIKLMRWWGEQLSRAQSGVQVLTTSAMEVA